MGKTIMAYKRKHTFGIRNYVLVISMVHCANAVVNKICAQTGAIPIVHDKGCCEPKTEHGYTVNALINSALNPNVHSALLVGLGCEQTDGQRVLEAIQKCGKLVRYLKIQDLGGSPQTEKQGVELVKEMLAEATRQPREPVDASKLIVGVQCGGSDWTTALTGNTTIGIMADLIVENGGSILMTEVGGFPGSEHIVAQNAQTYEIGLQILDMVGERRANYLAHYGHTIEEVNPTPGNKAGGITTLVEKSTGNIKKMGSSKVQGVIELFEKIPYPGLWIINDRTVGLDAVHITGLALSGAHLLVFSTGRGTPVGNAVMPTIKITGNPDSYQVLESILDFNAGAVINGADIQETGKNLYDFVIAVAEGKLTKSEINGNFEFVMLYPKL